MRLDSYKFSQAEIAGFTCIDCGVNVIEAGDFCMLQSSIWNDQLHLKWEDNLCVKHIEARLGRKLRPQLLGDFAGFPSVEGYPMSDILRDRIIGADFIRLKSGQTVSRKSVRGKAELRRQKSSTSAQRK
jgi:hypothetical protein